MEIRVMGKIRLCHIMVAQRKKQRKEPNALGVWVSGGVCVWSDTRQRHHSIAVDGIFHLQHFNIIRFYHHKWWHYMSYQKHCILLDSARLIPSRVRCDLQLFAVHAIRRSVAFEFFHHFKEILFSASAVNSPHLWRLFDAIRNENLFIYVQVVLFVAYFIYQMKMSLESSRILRLLRAFISSLGESFSSCGSEVHRCCGRTVHYELHEMKWIMGWMRCARARHIKSKVNQRECKSWWIYTAKKMTYILNEINLWDFSFFIFFFSFSILFRKKVSGRVSVRVWHTHAASWMAKVRMS